MRCRRSAMPGQRVQHQLQRADGQRQPDSQRRARPARADQRQHHQGRPAPSTTSCSTQPNGATAIDHRGSGPKNSARGQQRHQRWAHQRVGRRSGRSGCRGSRWTGSGRRARSVPPASSRYGTTSNNASCCAVHTQYSVRPRTRRRTRRSSRAALATPIASGDLSARCRPVARLRTACHVPAGERDRDEDRQRLPRSRP